MLVFCQVSLTGRQSTLIWMFPCAPSNPDTGLIIALNSVQVWLPWILDWTLTRRSRMCLINNNPVLPSTSTWTMTPYFAKPYLILPQICSSHSGWKEIELLISFYIRQTESRVPCSGWKQKPITKTTVRRIHIKLHFFPSENGQTLHMGAASVCPAFGTDGPPHNTAFDGRWPHM